MKRFFLFLGICLFVAHSCPAQTLTKDRFKSIADKWAQHCQQISFSSNTHAYTDDPSYRNLVALGRPAVPYIIERYRHDDLWWGFVLEDITGLHMVDRGNFNSDNMKQGWLEWWDNQADRKSFN